MSSGVRGARCALAFLTRLPGGAHAERPVDLASALLWFPVVGALVGALVSAAYVSVSAALPALTAAGLAVGLSAVITGALHEDGFADSLDALAGGRDVQHRLEILKDSRHGTFGVLGLVVLTLVKASALAAVDGWAAVGALVGAGALGRSAAVGLLWWAPAAGGAGLAASFRAALTPARAVAAAATGVVIGVLALGPWLVVLAAAQVAVGTVAVAAWAQRRIGGVTGDLLGAVEQVGECAVLALVAAAPGAMWLA